MLIAVGILFLFLFAGSLYVLNQEFVRITKVQIFGADQSLAEIAERAMRGSYFGIIPRNTILFYPAARIRSDILAAFPDIAAVSLSRSGLTSLSIRVSKRVPIAKWCGTTAGVARSLATTSLEMANDIAKDCYFFDASGVVYATTTTDQPVNTFSFYEPLASGSETIAFGLLLPNAHTLPSAFDFARQLDTFGSPVVSVVFRSGEVDDTLSSGTRITYVLGNEQNAFTALVSARANLDLAGGSIEYIDLRFDGKVYLKRKSGTVQ